MELREKVAFLLIAVVWFLAVCSVCTPQSLRKNPFEKYLNKQKYGRSNYLSKYEIEDRHEDFQGLKVYKTLNFPEVDHPSDTSSKVPIYLPKTKFDSSSKTSSFDVLSDSDFLNNLRKEKRRKRKYQQIQKPYTREDQPLLSAPEYFYNQEPSFYFTEMGLFPEVQYPLTAAETWTPHYWNPLLSINKDPYFKIDDDLYQNTSQKKKNTDTFIQPSAMKGNKGIIAVVNKTKEEIPKIDTLKNVTDVKNDKQLKNTPRKKKIGPRPNTVKLLKHYVTTEMPLKLEEMKIKSKEHTSPGITKKKRNSQKKITSEAQNPSKEPNSLKKVISESSTSRFKSRQLPKVTQPNNKTNTESPESLTIQCTNISRVNNKTGNLITANSSDSNIQTEHSSPKLSPDFVNGIPMNPTIKDTFINVPLQLLTDTIPKTVPEDQTRNKNLPSEIIPEVPLLENLDGHSVNHNLVNYLFKDELTEKNSTQGKTFSGIDDIDKSNMKSGNDLFILNAPLTDTTPLMESYAAYPISLNALQSEKVFDLPKKFNKNSVRKQILDVVLSTDKHSVSSVKNKILEILESGDFNSNEEDQRVLIYNNSLNEAINESQAATDSPEITLFNLTSTDITESLAISPNTIITDNPAINASELMTIPIETIGIIEVNPVTNAHADNLRELIAKSSSSNSLVDDIREIIRLLTVWNSHIDDFDDVNHKTIKNDMNNMNWTEFIPKSTKSATPEKLIEFIPDFTSRNALLADDSGEYITKTILTDAPEEIIPEPDLKEDSVEDFLETTLDNGPDGVFSEPLLNDKSDENFLGSTINDKIDKVIPEPTNDDSEQVFSKLSWKENSIRDTPENKLNNNSDGVLEPVLNEDSIGGIPKPTSNENADRVIPALTLNDDSSQVIQKYTLNDDIGGDISVPTLSDDSVQVISEQKLNDDSREFILEPEIKEDSFGGISEPTLNKGSDRVILDPSLNKKSDEVISKLTLNIDLGGAISETTLNDDSYRFILEPRLNEDLNETISEPSLNEDSRRDVFQPSLNDQFIGGIPEPKLWNRSNEAISKTRLNEDFEPTFNNDTGGRLRVNTFDDKLRGLLAEPTFNVDLGGVNHGQTLDADFSEIIPNPTLDDKSTGVHKEALDEKKNSIEIITYSLASDSDMFAENRTYNSAEITTDSGVNDNYTLVEKPAIYSNETKLESNGTPAERPTMDNIDAVSDDTDNADKAFSKNELSKAWAYEMPSTFMYHDIVSSLAQEKVSNHPISFVSTFMPSSVFITENSLGGSKDIISENNLIAKTLADDFNQTSSSNENISTRNDPLSDNSDEDDKEIFTFDTNEDTFNPSSNDILADDKNKVSPESECKIITNDIPQSPSDVATNAELDSEYELTDSSEINSDSMVTLSNERYVKSSSSEFPLVFTFDDIISSSAEEVEADCPILIISTLIPLSDETLGSLQNETETTNKHLIQSDENRSEEVCPIVKDSSFKNQCYIFDGIDGLNYSSNPADILTEKIPLDISLGDSIAEKPMIDSSEVFFYFAAENSDMLVEKPPAYASETISVFNDALAERPMIDYNNAFSDDKANDNETFTQNEFSKAWPYEIPSTYLYHDTINSITEKTLSEYPISINSTFLPSSDNMNDNNIKESREIITDRNFISKPLTDDFSKTYIDSKVIEMITDNSLTKISGSKNISQSAHNDSLPDNSAEDDSLPKEINIFTFDSNEEYFKFSLDGTLANDKIKYKVNSESESKIIKNDVHESPNNVFSDSELDDILSADSNEEKSESNDTISNERFIESSTTEFSSVFAFNDIFSSLAEENEAGSPISFMSTYSPSLLSNKTLLSLQNEAKLQQKYFLHSDENRSEEVCPITKESSFKNKCYTFDEIDGLNSTSNFTDILSGQIRLISEENFNDHSAVNFLYKTPQPDILLVDLIDAKPMIESNQVIFGFPSRNNDILDGKHTIVSISESVVNNNDTLMETPTSYSSETITDSDDILAEKSTIDCSDFVSDTTDNGNKTWPTEMPSAFIYHDIVSSLAEEKVSENPTSFVSTYMHGSDSITDNSSRGVIAEHNLIAVPLTDNYSKTFVNSKGIQTITKISSTESKYIGMFTTDSSEEIFELTSNDTLANDNDDSKVISESESYIKTNDVHHSSNDVFSDSEQDSASLSTNSSDSNSRVTLSDEPFTESLSNEFPLVFTFDDIISSSAEEYKADSPISLISRLIPSSDEALLSLQNETETPQNKFIHTDENTSEEVCPIPEDSSFKNQCFTFDEIDGLNPTSNVTDILSSGQIRLNSEENSTDPSIDDFPYKTPLPDILLVDLIAAKPMIDSCEVVFGYPSRNNEIFDRKHTIVSSEIIADSVVNNNDTLMEKPTSYSSQTVTDSNDTLADKSTIDYTDFVSDTTVNGNKTWPTEMPSAFIYHDIVSSLAEEKVSENPTSFVSTYMHGSDSITDNNSREIIADHNLIAKPLTDNFSKTFVNSKGIQTITKLSSTEHISESALNHSLPDNSANDDSVPENIGMFTSNSNEEIFEFTSNDTLANDDSKVSSESESYIRTNDIHHSSNDVDSDSEQDSASLSIDSSEGNSNSRITLSESSFNEFPLVFTSDYIISSSAEEDEADSPISFISTLIPSSDEALLSLQNETETPQNQFIRSDQNGSEEVCPFTEDSSFKSQCYTFDEIGGLNLTSNITDILSANSSESSETPFDSSHGYHLYKTPLSDLIMGNILSNTTELHDKETLSNISKSNDMPTFNVISEFSDYISGDDTSNYVDDTFRYNIFSNETSSEEN